VLSCWVYKESVPDRAKITKYQIGQVFIDPRSTNAVEVIASLRQYGVTPGIYECPGWYNNPTPTQFVAQVTAHANELIPRLIASAPPLMLDLEGVSKQWIASAVTLYRKSQPRRPTSFTTEPWQDGTVVPIKELVAAKMDWYVQLYRGDMSPVDAAAAVLEVCRWGYPPSMIHPFYDGANLPLDHRDGCIFVMERLP
jgi:hypothetical protein